MLLTLWPSAYCCDDYIGIQGLMGKTAVCTFKSSLKPANCGQTLILPHAEESQYNFSFSKTIVQSVQTSNMLFNGEN